MRPRDYLRECAECVRALPGFIGERLDALVAEMEFARAEREFIGGVFRQPQVTGGDADALIRLTRGVAVMPRATIEKYGDDLRALHPDVDLVAAEDIILRNPQ